MSVMVTIVVNADPKKLEEYAAGNPQAMRATIQSAEQHGLIAHRFYGSDDGRVMVVDEWPDPQSFQTFFAANSARIGPMMQAAGVTSEPQATFWRTLQTNDAYGWGA